MAIGGTGKAENFNLLEATIPELQTALSDGILTSQCLVEWYLARIEAYDQCGPKLNAISVVNRCVLNRAVQLDAERAEEGPRGPLHGIPLIIKDNYETSDMQTAAGSAAFRGWIPPSNAFLVEKLLAAGAIVLAKGNMHEFAYGITTVGSLFGQTLNPYALDRNPGGSSGGTAVAVAANFGAAGMGSDTCGSIRIPASHNSLAGIRGTQGLLSRSGIVPFSRTQDIGGPLARSVTDLAILLDATVGYDPEDPETAESVGNTPASYTASLQADGLKGARIGLLVPLLGSEPEESEVAEIVMQAVSQMQEEGAELAKITIPDLESLITDRYNGHLVLMQDFKFDLNAYLARRPTAPYRTLEEIVASGKPHLEIEANLQTSLDVPILDTKEYLEHLVKRTLLKRAILATMADHALEALVYPTIRRKAARLGERQAGSNCQLSANSGLPSVTVPVGFTADGLPVGVEWLGRAWDEPLLLKLAYAYEQATHHRRVPASTPELFQ
jgi:Asp-tRNA(Asn)/Glu-tRNA(Gln) amidotransferase A subunit family amidase